MLTPEMVDVEREKHERAASIMAQMVVWTCHDPNIDPAQRQETLCAFALANLIACNEDRERFCPDLSDRLVQAGADSKFSDHLAGNLTRIISDTRTKRAFFAMSFFNRDLGQFGIHVGRNKTFDEQAFVDGILQLG